METKELDNEYVAHSYGRFNTALSKGKGSTVYDESGKEYIDFGSGIGVTAFGLCDNEWKAAVEMQLDKMQHVSNLYYTEPCAKLAKMLCDKTDMKKVFFVFLLIFSLLIIGGKEYKCESKEDSFSKIEGYVINNYDFVQNGIKLEYTVDEKLCKEYLRIKQFFEENNFLVLSTENNNITAESENIDYSINICEYNDLIKVQVILINNDVSKSEEELKKLSQKIRNDNFINERYFSFIKGKLNTQDKNLIDDLEKNLNIKVNEYLDINNGCVAEATFEDNQHINIGQIKYDTGSYLIIGTPIIFVTY